MIFRVQDGCYTYPHADRQVLQNINLSFSDHEVFAILGPNGAGKTTLLKCALGLLPWKHGSTLLDGTPIATMPARALWQKIAYVPQAKHVVSASRVEEMVLLGRSSHISAFSAPSSEDVRIARETMERLNLLPLRDKLCSEISGGELQMVLIARALSAQPELLILDEPESNLDFRNQLLVLDTMTELARSGTACMFNTHYPAHALRRADYALMLGRDGQYVCGRASDVVTEENIEKFFGVHAVIGEIETQGNQYADVIPLRLTDMTAQDASPSRDVVAAVSIVMPDRSQADVINSILHQYKPWIIGRMGLPHPDRDLNIIQLTLDAPLTEVRRLMSELHRLPGLQAKTTYKEVHSR